MKFLFSTVHLTSLSYANSDSSSNLHTQSHNIEILPKRIWIIFSYSISGEQSFQQINIYACFFTSLSLVGWGMAEFIFSLCFCLSHLSVHFLEKSMDK